MMDERDSFKAFTIGCTGPFSLSLVTARDSFSPHELSARGPPVGGVLREYATGSGAHVAHNPVVVVGSNAGVEGGQGCAPADGGDSELVAGEVAPSTALGSHSFGRAALGLADNGA